MRSRVSARSASRIASSRSDARFSMRKKLLSAGFDAFGRIDFARAQALAQRFRRHIDQNHFIGERQDAVGKRLAHDRPGHTIDDLAERFEMLHVQRREHVDACAQKREHVQEAFGRDRSRRVRVREFVD